MTLNLLLIMSLLLNLVLAMVAYYRGKIVEMQAGLVRDMVRKMKGITDEMEQRVIDCEESIFAYDEYGYSDEVTLKYPRPELRIYK
jgi:hypothetical protein